MRILLAALFSFWSLCAAADPVRYLLDGSASRIEFTFRAENLPIVGQVPVSRAEVMVDFDNLGASSVDVTLNVARATTGVPFATEAMKGGSVLAAATYPTARFVSRKITGIGDGARLEGLLTLRGVTRSVVLDGAIFRRRGSEVGDLSNLVLLFTGQVDRRAFGATGYGHLVGDKVDLRILVAITRAG